MCQALGAFAGGCRGTLVDMGLGVLVGVALIIFLLGALSGSGFFLAWRDRRIARQVTEDQRTHQRRTTDRDHP
jgi:hypothetical protein